MISCMQKLKTRVSFIVTVEEVTLEFAVSGRFGVCP